MSTGADTAPSHEVGGEDERPDALQASRSKLIVVPVATLFGAWEDPETRREWLGDDSGFEIHEATPERFMRIGWVDGKTSLSVTFYAKGRAKSQVQVIHEGLPDAGTVERMKGYWGERLERLRELVDG